MKLFFLCLLVPALTLAFELNSTSIQAAARRLLADIDSLDPKTTTEAHLDRIYTDPYTRTNYECGGGETEILSLAEFVKIIEIDPNSKREYLNFHITGKYSFSFRIRRDTVEIVYKVVAEKRIADDRKFIRVFFLESETWECRGDHN